MTIGKKITIGFGLALTILIAIGLLAYFSVTGLIANNHAVMRTGMVVADFESLLSLMKDAETGQRGFIITGNPKYLEPYASAVESLDQSMKELRKLITDEGRQERRLEKLEPLIAAKMKELGQTIDLRKSKGFEAVVAVVNSDAGKTYMDDIRKLIGEGKTEEQALLTQRTHDAETGAQWALYIIGAGTSLALVLVLGAGVFITRSITKPLRAVVEASRSIASGDLRAKTIPASSDLEIRQLAGAYGQMVAGLTDLTGQIRSVTENVNSAATQISASASQQATGTKEQAATVQEITTTMQEISQAGAQIVERARTLSTAAEASASASAVGMESVRETARTMEAIREQVEDVAENIVAVSEKTQTIGDIVATVNEVAEQSNLLALNATIEAVSAGEQGSRFSVVANEMKSLADQAKRCTVQVRDILGDIQKGINKSVMLTEEAVKRVESGREKASVTEDTIRQLSETTENSVQAFQQILAATNQQQIGLEQVTQGMEDIRVAAQQTATGTSQLTQAVSNLTALSRQLKTAVGSYQV